MCLYEFGRVCIVCYRMHISSKKILDLNIPCVVAFRLLHFLGISVVIQAYWVDINRFMIYL